MKIKLKNILTKPAHHSWDYVKRNPGVYSRTDHESKRFISLEDCSGVLYIGTISNACQIAVDHSEFKFIRVGDLDDVTIELP